MGDLLLSSANCKKTSFILATASAWQWHYKRCSNCRGNKCYN